MTLLSIEHITKEYRQGARANDDVSLSVEAGEIYGLLGPNGAGKTTLVHQIIGLVAPTSGAIRIAGVDVVENPGHARQACSFQPQSQVPIDGLTPSQAISLMGRMRGGTTESVRQRTQELIRSLEISLWAHERGERLSGGVRRLVAFCMATVVPGQLVILDEPTNDVDPLRRRLLWQAVRVLADQGSAVLLVTHNVLEAERSVDRLAIIDRGRVVAAGTPASLKERQARDLRLELILEPKMEPFEKPGFLSQSVTVGRRMILKFDRASLGQAVSWANTLKENRRVEEFSVGPATLEDVYVRRIGRPEAMEMPTMEVDHVLRVQVAA